MPVMDDAISPARGILRELVGQVLCGAVQVKCYQNVSGPHQLSFASVSHVGCVCLHILV